MPFALTSDPECFDYEAEVGNADLDKVGADDSQVGDFEPGKCDSEGAGIPKFVSEDFVPESYTLQDPQYEQPELE